MKLPPFENRDFRRGVYRKSSISNSLAPSNSVSHSININYDTIIGSAVVRPGTTLVGSAVAAGKIPLGLSEFVTSGGTLNLLLSVFKGVSNSTLYYFDSSWHASGLTALNNTANVRFATFGNRAFMANGVDAMKSSADGATWATTDCITTDSVIPSLLHQTKGRMLASGYSGFRDRVYFSSIIDPNSNPFITWNTNPSTGDWIDINPDDGSNVTGFAETSNLVLVFKGKGMYRLNTVTKTVDSENIFNIGAVSQEAIVECQGIVYFFSGQDIRSTNGGYPEQISRLGVQDFIDAIPQASWASATSSVVAGTDGLNVYFSIGNVTLNTNQNNQTNYNQVVLKFSPRDQSWSVHSYGQTHKYYAQYTNSNNGRKMIEADSSGSVQTVNVGSTDNTVAINYDLQSQELEFGNRSHLKNLENKFAVYTQYGLNSSIQIKANDDDFKDVKSLTLNDRVNLGTIASQGNFFTFRWFGVANQKAPILEGYYFESIDDKGLTPKPKI